MFKEFIFFKNFKIIYWLYITSPSLFPQLIMSSMGANLQHEMSVKLGQFLDMENETWKLESKNNNIATIA